MAKKLYVGNLPHAVDNSELQSIFEAHGTVESAQVIMDRYTGRSKGFGFVEMASENEAKSAIEAMNGAEVGGRPLTVNEARPQADRGSSGGGGDRRSFRDAGNRGGGGGKNRY